MGRSHIVSHKHPHWPKMTTHPNKTIKGDGGKAPFNITRCTLHIEPLDIVKRQKSRNSKGLTLFKVNKEGPKQKHVGPGHLAFSKQILKWQKWKHGENRGFASLSRGTTTLQKVWCPPLSHKTCCHIKTANQPVFASHQPNDKPGEKQLGLEGGKRGVFKTAKPKFLIVNLGKGGGHTPRGKRGGGPRKRGKQTPPPGEKKSLRAGVPVTGTTPRGQWVKWVFVGGAVIKKKNCRLQRGTPQQQRLQLCFPLLGGVNSKHRTKNTQQTFTKKNNWKENCFKTQLDSVHQNWSTKKGRKNRRGKNVVWKIKKKFFHKQPGKA